MAIRKIKKTDINAFEKLQRQLDDESIYMAFELEDRNVWAKNLSNFLEWIAAQKNSAIFVAEREGQLIGFLQITQHSLVRTKHIATLFIGVLQCQTGKGVGKLLFEAFEKWLKQTELKRIELTVLVQNEPAVKLYKKRGFSIEGTKRSAFLISGKYYDEFYMSKIVSVE